VYSYGLARSPSLIQILCAYIRVVHGRECAESRAIYGRARTPPFFVVSLINPEWPARKPLVFVVETARTVNFVASWFAASEHGGHRHANRNVSRSSCARFSLSFLLIRRGTFSPLSLLPLLFTSFRISLVALRLKCKRFLRPHAPDKCNTRYTRAPFNQSAAYYNYRARRHYPPSPLLPPPSGLAFAGSF